MEIIELQGRFGQWTKESLVVVSSVTHRGPPSLCPLRIDLISIIRFTKLPTQHQGTILPAFLVLESLPQPTCSV